LYHNSIPDKRRGVVAVEAEQDQHWHPGAGNGWDGRTGEKHGWCGMAVTLRGGGRRGVRRFVGTCGPWMETIKPYPDQWPQPDKNNGNADIGNMGSLENHCRWGTNRNK